MPIKADSTWVLKATGRNYVVPLGGPDEDGDVVAVNMSECWSGPADEFLEAFRPA